MRTGETDKIYISEAGFQRSEDEGKFIYVKELYGNKYGTPILGVNEIQNQGKIPILDFPLSDIDKFIFRSRGYCLS